MIHKRTAQYESDKTKSEFLKLRVEQREEEKDIIQYLYNKHKTRIEKYIDSKIEDASKDGKFFTKIDSNKIKRIPWEYRYSVMNIALDAYQDAGYQVEDDPSDVIVGWILSWRY